jgi:glycosyltransferase involved in cell wall biosynthesis
MKAVAVIVPTMNRPMLLREALSSLVRQTRVPDEIIVVDDGSREPVREDDLRSEFGPAIRVLRNEHPQGLASARYRGAAASTAAYIAHLDDDDRFAPHVIDDAVAPLEEDPQIELAFMAARGFGERAAHFDKVQQAGVGRVVAEGGGRELSEGVIAFGAGLFQALLNGVPIAFQRIVARRSAWQRITSLRRRAYKAVEGLVDEEAAQALIGGPMRDSELALYAGLSCKRTVLILRPGYLQRCEGQGTSSLPSMRERHVEQIIGIKSNLYRASALMPEIAPWHALIRHSLAQTYFERAYELYRCRARGIAWRYWLKSVGIRPAWGHLKLGLRLALPGGPSGA